MARTLRYGQAVTCGPVLAHVYLRRLISEQVQTNLLNERLERIQSRRAGKSTVRFVGVDHVEGSVTLGIDFSHDEGSTSPVRRAIKSVVDKVTDWTNSHDGGMRLDTDALDPENVRLATNGGYMAIVHKSQCPESLREKLEANGWKYADAAIRIYPLDDDPEWLVFRKRGAAR